MIYSMFHKNILFEQIGLNYRPGVTPLSQPNIVHRPPMNPLPNQKLLVKLADSVDASRFLLVCDHLGSNSSKLIKTLVYNRLKQLSVNIVCTETHSQLFCQTDLYPSDREVKTELKINDLFNKYHTIESNLSQHLLQSLTEVSDQTVVIIDSLTPFLIIDSLHDISRLLTQLYNRFRQLVCVLHVDCHSQYICESIEHLSHSVIHLTTTPDNKFKAIIRHRKLHRKTHFAVKESMEFFTINDHKIAYIKQNESTKSESTPSHTTSDPTVNLPFNLNLKDNELEAKNNLVLPYVKAADNESKVFYEYDKNDDIDEDDPDDDLDI